ncbi:MAG: hypothetical protein IKU37_02685 [Candidatus Gastranaerophilales bacterium]|nr:hypothetical protein [Candidatus Gastranaerophilales bacterium]
MNNQEEIIKDMQAVIHQMVLDDIEENPDSEFETFSCSACANDAMLAGSIQYKTHRLCNNCVLMYELALKLGKVQNIDEFMEKTEDNRLQNVCNFIKQESVKENN